ncbi:MAG: SURF1 family protein [Limnobacter sp.]|nr:SURF1 family protein [Limnobacter sp.]
MTPQERPASFKKLVWSSLAGFLFLTFCGLGTWQLFRLDSKVELIAQVESRAYGSPVAAPGPEAWGEVALDGFEYTRLTLTGRFLEEQTLYTLAVTKLGSGFWMLTPMRTTQGFDVWVNRGFVPTRPRETVNDSNHESANKSAGEAISNPTSHPLNVVGLLRLSEPEGGFLRANKPEEGRWYSRDVLAMSASRGLTQTAPYFVDAFEVRGTSQSHTKKPSTEQQNPPPVPGLTVLQFHNNHMVYALTWFGLALMVAGVAIKFRPAV